MSYYTFPLCLLAADKDPKEIIQDMVAQSVVRAGERHCDRDATRSPQADKYLAEKEFPPGFDAGKPRHVQLVTGAMVLNITLGNVVGTLTRWKETSDFVSGYERVHGGDALVMIGGDLLWGCHNDGDPDWRTFSTLAAINSIIGQKKVPVRITRDMIIARQLGYKTSAIMRAALPGNPHQKPLTIQRVRDTLDSLEAMGLIVRCQASRRVVYFSTTLTREELIEKVKGIREKRNKIELARAEERGLFKQEP